MPQPKSPYNPTDIPDCWHNLGWYFDGILIHALTDKKLSAFSSYDPKKHTYEDVELMLDSFEKDWLPEVESAISVLSLSADIDLSGFSEEAISILVRRAETIASFIHSLHVNEASIFGLPRKNYQECIQWLMIDWWNSHGKPMTVDIFLSEYPTLSN